MGDLDSAALQLHDAWVELLAASSDATVPDGWLDQTMAWLEATGASSLHAVVGGVADFPLAMADAGVLLALNRSTRGSIMRLVAGDPSTRIRSVIRDHSQLVPSAPPTRRQQGPLVTMSKAS